MEDSSIAQGIYHEGSLVNSTFLITGGAGFIGSNCVEYLIRNNAKLVRVLDNFSTGRIENLQEFIKLPQFELIEGDIRNIDDCRKALKDIDYVSHQAALGSVPRSIKDPITTNQVNVDGFLNILQAVKEAEVKKFVYAASSSTYGDSKNLPKIENIIGKPLSPYAVTKYVNELYAQVFSDLYSIDIIGLRYFNVFGPKQDPNGAYAAVVPLFLKAALSHQAPMINGDGEHTRDFTFVENAVQANIRAFFSAVDGHEVYNIAYGERTSLNQLWKFIQQLSHSVKDPIYRDARSGDVKDSLADISKAKKKLGYDPQYSLQQGLGVTYNWYKNNG